MFSRLKHTVKGVLGRLFGTYTLKRELNVDVSISNEMRDAIDLWHYMYKDKSPWIDDTTQSMNLASVIAGEFARLVTLELKTSIEGNDYLNEQYQKVIKKIRNYTEYACAKGGLVFKPYIDGDNIAIDLTQANNFYPTEFNSSGDVIGAIFTEFKQTGNMLYTRLEYHRLAKDGYHISNLAFEKQNYNNSSMDLNSNIDLGNRIPLSQVEEWSSLEEETCIKNIDKPLFSYFKIPIANNIDSSSPLGVSVYSRAVEQIKEADKQYSRILWEYEGSELAINAGIEAFTTDKKGRPILPTTKQRLYRTFEFDNSSGNKILDTFSPAIRDESLFNGLNELLRKIEFNCGLAYGTLSNVQETAKTATEIIMSKQRSYATVSDIQKSLEYALKNLVYAMNVWAFLIGKSNSNEYEMTFNWDDSLIVDKKEELASMQQDVSSGLIRPELYIMKKYGVDKKTAQEMMPQAEDTIKPLEYDEE